MARVTLYTDPATESIVVRDQLAASASSTKIK
jgi:hypothetical protein